VAHLQLDSQWQKYVLVFEINHNRRANYGALLHHRRLLAIFRQKEGERR
jgi:hypothetical protein